MKACCSPGRLRKRASGLTFSLLLGTFDSLFKRSSRRHAEDVTNYIGETEQMWNDLFRRKIFPGICVAGVALHTGQTSWCHDTFVLKPITSSETTHVSQITVVIFWFSLSYSLVFLFVVTLRRHLFLCGVLLPHPRRSFLFSLGSFQLSRGHFSFLQDTP